MVQDPRGPVNTSRIFNRKAPAGLRAGSGGNKEEEMNMVTDTDRLDWLEDMADRPGGILLHDGSETGRVGIGLRPGAMVRSLRVAIDQAMKSNDDDARRGWSMT